MMFVSINFPLENVFVSFSGLCEFIMLCNIRAKEICIPGLKCDTREFFIKMTGTFSFCQMIDAYPSF